MAWTDYTWIVVVGALAAFLTAFGIGANDVANAFGSSVAARTLTMRQALLIASVCEFGGSVLLGGEVTRTMAGGIARLAEFDRDPEIYMYGMLCATVASGAWLLLATYLSLPVSTTHATVGAVLGFAFVYGGADAVVWLEPQDDFPYVSGLVPIIMAWFTSPLMSGLASAFLFLLVRTAILRRERSLDLAIWALPVLVLVTVFINLFFVLYKGSEARLMWGSDKCAWVSAAAAGGCTTLTIIIIVPLVRQQVDLATAVRRRQEILAAQARTPSRAPIGARKPLAADSFADTGKATATAATICTRLHRVGGSSVTVSFCKSGGGDGGGSGGNPAASAAAGVAAAVATAAGGAASAVAEGGVRGTGAASGSVPGLGSRSMPHEVGRFRGHSFGRSVGGGSSSSNDGGSVGVVPGLHIMSGAARVSASAASSPRASTAVLAVGGRSGSKTGSRSREATGAVSVGVRSPSAAECGELPQQEAARAQAQPSLPTSGSGQGPLHAAGSNVTLAAATVAESADEEGAERPVTWKGQGQETQQQSLIGYRRAPEVQGKKREGEVQKSSRQGWHCEMEGMGQVQVQVQGPCWYLQHQSQQQTALGSGADQQGQGQSAQWDLQQHILLQQQQLQQHQQQLLQHQNQHRRRHQQRELLVPEQPGYGGFWGQGQQQKQQQTGQARQCLQPSCDQETLWLQQPQHTQQQQPQHTQQQPQRTQHTQQHTQLQQQPQQQQQQQQPQLQRLWQQQRWQHQQYTYGWQLQPWQEPPQQLQQQQQEWQQQQWRSLDPSHTSVPSNQRQSACQHPQQQLREQHSQQRPLKPEPCLEPVAESPLPNHSPQGRGITPSAGPVVEGLEHGSWVARSPVAAVPYGRWSGGPGEGEGGHGGVSYRMGAEDSESTDGSAAEAHDHDCERLAQGQETHGSAADAALQQLQKTFDQLKAIVLHGTEVDVHECLRTGGDERALAMHAHAEVFDASTEHAFKYLQVVTAVCDSFSHGANDVANSVGPLAAIFYIYQHQRVDFDANLPVWILALGGAGIVVGLATYGYNIIRAIGMRLSVVTPSRGFCIELATALVVVLASKYGLPVSTTHCQVGSTAAMGLLEGASGLNWLLAGQFFLGWVVTLLLTGLLSAGLFAAGAFAPSVQQGREINAYKEQMWALAAKLDLLLNRSNAAALTDPVKMGNYSTELAASLEQDLRWLRTAANSGSSLSTRPVQHVEADYAYDFLSRAVDTYINNSLPYIGGIPARGQ